MDTPVLETTVTLEKYPGKGGWVFFIIPPEQAAVLGPPVRGYLQVTGTLDAHPVEYCTLFSNGKGGYFFAVRADLRKAINKREGQEVAVRLWRETRPYPIPEDLAEGLAAMPEAEAFFATLTDAQRRYFIDWITTARQPETRMQRMVTTLLKLESGKKFHDK